MRTWALLLAFFALVGLFFAGQVWVDYAYAGQRLSWGRATAVAVAEWMLWAFLAPLVLWLGRRFRFGRRRWLLALAVHLPASLVLTVAKIIADGTVAAAVTNATRMPFSLLKLYLTFLTYWAVLGTALWYEHYRAWRDRELQALTLQAELARAQVQALKAQLHPHFLFNTLNTTTGHYLTLHVGRESHLLREALGRLEARLDGERFVRIHRSTIVNVDRLRELQPSFHGECMLTLCDGTRLQCSRTYAGRLNRLLGS
jgi:hypothetical protein